MENSDKKIIGGALIVFLLVIGFLTIRSISSDDAGGDQTDTSLPQPITVSGTVLVTGYIPTDSKVTVMYRPTSQGDYMPMELEPNATSSNPFLISPAIDGEMYKIYANLYDAFGNPIGESMVKSVKAPAGGINIELSSSASQE